MRQMNSINHGQMQAGWMAGLASFCLWGVCAVAINMEEASTSKTVVNNYRLT